MDHIDDEELIELVTKHARLIKILEKKESLVLAEEIDSNNGEISDLNKKIDLFKKIVEEMNSTIKSKDDELNILRNDKKKLKEELDTLKKERTDFKEKILNKIKITLANPDV